MLKDRWTVLGAWDIVFMLQDRFYTLTAVLIPVKGSPV